MSTIIGVVEGKDPAEESPGSCPKMLDRKSTRVLGAEGVGASAGEGVRVPPVTGINGRSLFTARAKIDSLSVVPHSSYRSGSDTIGRDIQPGESAFSS